MVQEGVERVAPVRPEGGVQNLGGRRWVEPISPAFSDLTLQRQGQSWQGGLQWRP